MDLVEFPQQTVVIAKNQPPYKPMPAWQGEGDDGHTIVCWKLSMVERLKLLFTGRIWQHMLTFRNRMQPQKLTLEHPFKKP